MIIDQERHEGRSQVRAEAMRQDATRSEGFDLASLWPELCSASRRIVDTFTGGQRCYLVLEDEPDPGRPIPARSLQMLERVLLGHGLKAVASDFSVSVGTVAGSLHGALSAMGLACRISNLPMVVVMAARAHCLRQSCFTARVSPLWLDHQRVHVVSTPRLEPRLMAGLSKAELSVVGRLLEGLSYAQIANERGTSARTVANQLATAFRKLGVSGRGELVDQLIHDAARRAGNPLTPRAVRPERNVNPSDHGGELELGHLGC